MAEEKSLGKRPMEDAPQSLWRAEEIMQMQDAPQEETLRMAEEKSLGKRPMDTEPQEEALWNLTNKINDFSTSSVATQPFIFKVPCQQRDANPKAYEPVMISIGPYHHSKNRLREMQKHKLFYLTALLKREEDKPDCLKSYIQACATMEEAVRGCYGETIDMSKADFIEMMLLDSCFVIEVMRRYKFPELRSRGNDVLFKKNLSLSMVKRDLLLVENQLPLFLLDNLFRIMPLLDKEDKNTFKIMVLDFFHGIMPGQKPTSLLPSQLSPLTRRSITERNTQHLLDTVHEDVCSSLGRGVELFRFAEHIPEHERDKTWDSISSATDLYEVGIRFKLSEENYLFTVKFDRERAVLEIPRLMIHQDTEQMFRNNIALEQINQGFFAAAGYAYHLYFGEANETSNIFMAYARLMNCLVRDAKDVALLAEHGIVDNSLGSDEEVAKLFNKLGDTVFLSMDNFYYQDLYDRVNEYCQRQWNIPKVKLRQKHFLGAATVLLILTFLQTIFTVLGYFKPN